ncbi:TRAP transporter small permease [Trinickia violacea]|uniref:TRAP transporter small permease protein n=1 Tax=Trinickia violacea TaxID=2571746 RepID=A0A4P8IYQ3_9BURK|nr:TRAP transporter small permease [Trinickia violacea]QCP53586.1 TRAP transporter small permease [Trinickia violacea]
MNFVKQQNQIVARVVAVLASICLAVLCVLVMVGVVMRYVFDNAPDYVEPVGLLLVLVVAFMGAALKVRDGGHIGLDSLVSKLPPKGQVVLKAFQQLSMIAFAIAMCYGSKQMAMTTFDDQIPILGLPEAIRYLIPFVAGICTILFCIEHLLALIARKRT